MTCSRSVVIGAYLLGAIDAEERGAIEAHLDDCVSCRDELVGLAPLPGLLSRVPVGDVTATEQPPVVPKPPARRRSRNRLVIRGRYRRRTLAVAAVILGFVGVFAGGLVPVSPDPPATAPAQVTLDGSSEGNRLRASAALTPQSWGTKIQLRLRDPKLSADCRLVVVDRDGSREVVGSWALDSYSEDTVIPASSSTGLPDIAAVDIYTDQGERLVHLLVDTGRTHGTSTHTP